MSFLDPESVFFSWSMSVAAHTVLKDRAVGYPRQTSDGALGERIIDPSFDLLTSCQAFPQSIHKYVAVTQVLGDGATSSAFFVCLGRDFYCVGSMDFDIKHAFGRRLPGG